MVASSNAALSRTLRETACITDIVDDNFFGPWGVLPRLVFIPNRPQQEAGIRIEPPPSVALASGNIPAATAAAEPPEEPPALCSRFHGLRVSPNRIDSVVPVPTEFRAGRFTHDQQTRLLVSLHHGAGIVRHPVAIEARALCGYGALKRHPQILQQKRNTGKRSVRQACSGFTPGTVIKFFNDTINIRGSPHWHAQ